MLSTADINKLVKLKYYQAHNELISTANVSVIDSDANHLDLSFSGSYPVKVSSLRDFEVLSRDMIRILSHAEIFSFAALNYIKLQQCQKGVQDGGHNHFSKKPGIFKSKTAIF